MHVDGSWWRESKWIVWWCIIPNLWKITLQADEDHMVTTDQQFIWWLLQTDFATCTPLDIKQKKGVIAII